MDLFDKIFGRLFYYLFYAVGWVIMAFFQHLWWGAKFLFRRHRSSHPKFYELPLESRLAHTHILGGSGHGKTQSLQQLILEDLPRIASGRCSVVVIDSQGDMVRKFLKLKELAPGSALAKRLVVIDPTDVENPPCLNLFDFGLDRIKSYDALERETLYNGAVALYEYIFGALLGAELTNKQGVVFGYLARLLMVIPGATILTLLDIVDEPELVRPHLHKLDIQSQRFFNTQFLQPVFDATRQQIASRLWGVLGRNHTLAKMFAHPHNKLNLFEEMNAGRFILINTAKSLLKTEGSEIFGKFMIALLNQATQERAVISESNRMPTFVYIDEAADYLDEKMQELLDQARKFKAGLVIAHQNLDQFSRHMQAAVMSSTSIKFAGGVSDHDAQVIAKEMRCKPEFIQMMRKNRDDTRFALFVRNRMSAPAEYVVRLGRLEEEPTMGIDEQKRLLADNRQRYSAPYDRQVIASSTALTNAGVTFELEEPKPV